jgi:phospholipid/cholesterol/gamma-HCH transport system substrate-binding protein
MANRKFGMETAVGVFIVVGIACLVWLSLRLGKVEIGGGDRFPVSAEFASVAGLRAGGTVEIAGVQVGSIEAIDVKNYKAVVRMRVQRGIALPEDTIASVKTRGLIGDKYIGLSPGASDRMIAAGGKIRETEGALDIEALIGEFIHGSANK